MKKSKKILSLALTLTMLAGTLLSTSAFAAGAEDDYYYEKMNDGTVNIDGYRGDDSDIIMPDTLENRPVTSVDSYGYFDCEHIESVTLPTNTQTIGECTFENCNELSEITFNSKLTTIRNKAFYNDDQLTGAILPNSLTALGEDAFYGCTSVSNLTLSSGLTEIHNGTFEYCSSLTKVAIPSGVTAIDQNAFAWCTGLSEVTIPASVNNMSDSAFANDDDLTIKGYNGTYAQTYAKNHNIPFVSLGDVPIDTSIQLDTGSALSIKAGKFYTFKVTAKSKPTFTVGNNSVFKIAYAGNSGNNYFFKATAVGKAGQVTGFYINLEKTPRTVGTIK